MSSLTKSFLLASLTSIALSSPIEPRHLVLTEAVAKTRLSLPQHIARTYSKFGKKAPEHVQAAIKAAAESGSVVATPDENDSEYLAPVTIGGQTLNLDIDTGSSDLWVYSSQQPPQELSGHSYYDPFSSPTAQPLDDDYFEIQYGDGSAVVGDVVTDTVTVGGVSVSNQAVELAEDLSRSFAQEVNLDGIMGLAFSSINNVQPDQQQTFLDNAVSQSLLSSPLLTADLRANAPGTYTFGSLNSSYSPTYVPVDSSANGLWEFTASGYAVGSNDFVTQSIDAIADTGTTLVYLPSGIVDAYYSGVSGASMSTEYGGYVLDCGASAPDLTIGFNDYKAVVPGDYITYAPVEQGSSTCFGGIQANDGIPFSILGDVFLKSQFVVFDRGQMRFGVASKDL
ncbi:MAG: hypothetical protein Q9227_004550 [Pyrenula ochraceoflavens]